MGLHAINCRSISGATTDASCDCGVTGPRHPFRDEIATLTQQVAALRGALEGLIEKIADHFGGEYEPSTWAEIVSARAVLLAHPIPAGVVQVPVERIREVVEWLWGDQAYPGDPAACERELRALLQQRQGGG